MIRLVLALLIGLGPGPAHAADCGLRLMADLALRDIDGFLSVEAVLADRPVSLLVDTGSDAGFLSPGAARGLRTERAHPAELSGTGGRGRNVPVATASLALGNLRLDGVPFPLGDLPSMPRIVPAVVGLIGGDLLSHFEVEIDVSRGMLRLYEADGLSRLCRDLPPWPGRTDTVPLTRVGNRMLLAAMLDGRNLKALLDSGARSRIVSRSAALASGADPGTLDAEPGGITSGIDGHETLYHWHRFGTLSIGNETVHGQTLTVTTLRDQADMLLGADWFARHRVWISYGTSLLFTQPVAQR